MRIALLQYPIAWADKTTNLRLTEERIAALAGKADVAVLPEMFATGFCTDHPELAETMDGEIMTSLQRLADQYEIAIVGSFICLPITNSPSGRPIGGMPSNSHTVASYSISSSEMVIIGDSMYYYGTHWNDETMSNQITYGALNIRYPITNTQSLITDETVQNIKIPYGIQVNPYNGDIYITDAKNYVSSGQLHCYSREGKRKWSVRTGDIPAHMCFVYR